MEFIVAIVSEIENIQNLAAAWRTDEDRDTQREREKDNKKEWLHSVHLIFDF